MRQVGEYVRDSAAALRRLRKSAKPVMASRFLHVVTSMTFYVLYQIAPLVSTGGGCQQFTYVNVRNLACKALDIMLNM
jgi:hypothetical protein